MSKLTATLLGAMTVSLVILMLLFLVISILEIVRVARCHQYDIAIELIEVKQDIAKPLFVYKTEGGYKQTSELVNPGEKICY
jgi:hypothetical protein